MTSWEEMARLVAERAGNRCEYCQMHQILQGATFHVEHVLPRSRGGATALENLAWPAPGATFGKPTELTRSRRIRRPAFPSSTLASIDGPNISLGMVTISSDKLPWVGEPQRPSI